MRTATGRPRTGLVVIRGNGGSGRSSLARRRGRRLAVVAQDVVRRQILRVHDLPGNPAVGLIDAITRHCLTEGFDVVVEGTLGSGTDGELLAGLADDHLGRTLSVRYDLSFEETLRRHASRPATGFGEEEMRRWWREGDAVPRADEPVIDAGWSLDDAGRRIAELMGW